MAKSQSFTFDGGALTYWGTQVAAFFITLVTLGFAYPFALVLKLKWRTKHTKVNGVPLVFNGTAFGLIGRWLLWWLLTMVTFGIYSFWVAPRLNGWIVEHTDFNSSAQLPPSIMINGVTYIPLETSASLPSQLSSIAPQAQPMETKAFEPNLEIESSSSDDTLK